MAKIFLGKVTTQLRRDWQFFHGFVHKSFVATTAKTMTESV